MEAVEVSYELAVDLGQLPAATPFDTGADLVRLLQTTAELEQLGEAKPRRVDWRLNSITGTAASLRSLSEPDVASRAALSLVRGFHEAQHRDQLPNAWSIAAGNRAERVASRLGETIDTGLHLSVVGPDNVQAHVTRQAARNLQLATKLRISSYGSVTGTLGRVTAHNGRRAALWSDVTGRRVEVRFGEQHVEDMRDAWARPHVEITGVLWDNAAGQTLRVEMESLQVLDGQRISIVDALPRGFYPEMTGGLSAAEYLRLVRGEG